MTVSLVWQFAGTVPLMTRGQRDSQCLREDLKSFMTTGKKDFLYMSVERVLRRTDSWASPRTPCHWVGGWRGPRGHLHSIPLSEFHLRNDTGLVDQVLLQSSGIYYMRAAALAQQDSAGFQRLVKPSYFVQQTVKDLWGCAGPF